MARPFEFDRTEALEKAMVLFWRKGYFNTSAQDIVDHMRLNRSSIYNTFSDKRALFIESLKHYIGKESKGLTDGLAQMQPSKESLRQLLEMVVENQFIDEKPKGCLIVNTAIEVANYDEEIKKIIEDNINQVVSAFEGFIKVGQEQGNIGSTIPAHDLALALFHQVTALRVTGKIITNRTTFKNTIQAFMLLFN